MSNRAAILRGHLIDAAIALEHLALLHVTEAPEVDRFETRAVAVGALIVVCDDLRTTRSASLHPTLLRVAARAIDVGGLDAQSLSHLAGDLRWAADVGLWDAGSPAWLRPLLLAASTRIHLLTATVRERAELPPHNDAQGALQRVEAEATARALDALLDLHRALTESSGPSLSPVLAHVVVTAIYPGGCPVDELDEAAEALRAYAGPGELS